MLSDYPACAILPAQDLERAKEFYTNTLGLKEVQSMEGVSMISAGEGTMIVLYTKGDSYSKPEFTQAGFNVKDIENLVQDLTQKGVVFEHYDMGQIKTDENGIATLGPVKSAWFTDTEGNIIALNQM